MFEKFFFSPQPLSLPPPLPHNEVLHFICLKPAFIQMSLGVLVIRLANGFHQSNALFRDFIHERINSSPKVNLFFVTLKFQLLPIYLLILFHYFFFFFQREHFLFFDDCFGLVFCCFFFHPSPPPPC